MARGKAVSIVLSDEERLDLESRVRRRKSSHGTARRARIVLLAAEGLSNTAIAEKLGVSRLTVGTWRRRFAERRLEGLDDEPRPGAPRKIGDDKIVEVVTRTLETVPQDATHWSRRSMARATGLSATTVHRIWGAFGLQPHRVESFKLSSDPEFVDKVHCGAFPGAPVRRCRKRPSAARHAGQGPLRPAHRAHLRALRGPSRRVSRSPGTKCRGASARSAARATGQWRPILRSRRCAPAPKSSRRHTPRAARLTSSHSESENRTFLFRHRIARP